jgi:hypothetical protein
VAAPRGRQLCTWREPLRRTRATHHHPSRGCLPALQASATSPGTRSATQTIPPTASHTWKSHSAHRRLSQDSRRSVVVSSQAKFWQDCPSHKQWSDSSMNGKPFVPCTSRPALCIYRNDPISNALAACQVWNETKVGAGKHYSGSYCNFYWNNLPIPGVESTGTFDVTFAPGEVIPSKFTTNKTTTESVQGKMVQVTVSETVVVTSSNTSPDPAVFRGHCTPSGEDSEMRVL